MIDVRATRRRADQLVESVRAFRQDGDRVRRFRLNYSEGMSATLGIYDSKVGSVYAPFHLADGARGAFLLEWSDGLVSRGVIDGNTGGDLGPELEAAHGARYRDEEARHFPRPAPLSRTPLHDPAVDRILAGRFGLLYDLVELIRGRGRALRAKKVSGSVHASVGASTITTSAGLRYAVPVSEFSFSFAFDSELWDGRSRRRPLSVAAVARIIDRAAELLPALRRRVKDRRSGEMSVLLLPHFAAELVESYLIGNLYGSAVALGQSAFKPADFTAHRQVVRDDLSLRVDPTVPYSSGSYRITSEGLPARLEVYIEGGRLQRAIVGLKYARRLKVKPTTPPASMESVFLEGPRPLSEAAGLALLGDGIAVMSALGLHTQDTASGDFSLTAPQAMVVGDGKRRGSVKAVLAGNFFRALSDERLRLVRLPGQRFPALLTVCHATLG